jgi:hypothetical protein
VEVAAEGGAGAVDAGDGVVDAGADGLPGPARAGRPCGGAAADADGVRPLRRGAVPAQGPGVGRDALHRGLGLGDLVSRHDQELVVRLGRAGLVPLGKTNAPEFGRLPTCEPACSGRPQPLGPVPDHRRLRRRVGRGGRRRPGPQGPRQRPRRLDPLPRLLLWAVRPQADQGTQPARPRVRRRPRRHGRRARPDPLGSRQRRPAGRHRRPRPGRPVSGAMGRVGAAGSGWLGP